MIFRVIIGVLAILIDVAQMVKAYRNDNIAELLFWGILLVCVCISMN